MRAALSDAGAEPAIDDPSSQAAPGGDAFIVDVDGWEGPLDVLLALARAQKVDLRQISIVQLADQYLAYVAAARRASLELAAEYLVMAAWLRGEQVVPEHALGSGVAHPLPMEVAAFDELVVVIERHAIDHTQLIAVRVG